MATPPSSLNSPTCRTATTASQLCPRPPTRPHLKLKLKLTLQYNRSIHFYSDSSLPPSPRFNPNSPCLAA
ncbi:hypothetical protein BO70DRAFT_359541 [Aspergillus heteromorphus CBS 117.55]|uniref:Uncharacterized protein n=1 Tax=Aspergillus heteromorphus CBS 117.55 TaxID=1448321 RepID=A0A317WS12_9EURO|nr:uncharacterized protein BO70DRAFT_359541 [Aspergillus heteromorphus CBS 117.55]PWY89263.1 hypothetical protein BO70DRAFT_359541 [Aspergillus heteromorphus CBS 117.55]